ncbi:MAG: Pr6Pr family membrane protein [Gaiellales bacterium]
MQDRPLARTLYALTALSAAVGTVLAFAITGLGTEMHRIGKPGLFDDPGQDALGRLADLAAYFTEWSNVLVAIVFALLAIRTADRGTLMRVLLFDALLMIIITGLVYNAVLAPALAPRHGWDLLTTMLEHTVTPLLAVIVWAAFGPREWLRRRLILPALVLPIVWVIFTLIRGAIIDAYPYGFINVVELGYAMALINVGVILLIGIAICFGLIGIDRLARRWTPA